MRIGLSLSDRLRLQDITLMRLVRAKDVSVGSVERSTDD